MTISARNVLRGEVLEVSKGHSAILARLAGLLRCGDRMIGRPCELCGRHRG
jgi:hypothetical protein